MQRIKYRTLKKPKIGSNRVMIPKLGVVSTATHAQIDLIQHIINMKKFIMIKDNSRKQTVFFSKSHKPTKKSL